MIWKGGFALACCLAASALMPVSVLGQDNSQAEILERLQRLEEQQAKFSEQLRAKDDRIRELENQLAGSPVSPELTTAGSIAPVPQAQSEARVAASAGEKYFGEFPPGGRASSWPTPAGATLTSAPELTPVTSISRARMRHTPTLSDGPGSSTCGRTFSSTR